MSFEKKLMDDLKTAMKGKDQASLRGIRALKAAILVRKTDGSGKEIDESEYIKITQKLVKQRKESLSIYEEQGREDLASVEREEIAVLEQYLPEQLSDEALATIIDEVIAQVGASSMKDMGKVMGITNGKVGGQADGRKIAEIVKSKLG